MSKLEFKKFKKINNETFEIEKRTVSENISKESFTLESLEKQKQSILKARQDTEDDKNKTLSILDAQVAEIDNLISKAKAQGIKEKTPKEEIQPEV